MFENLPAFFHRAGAEIVARERECGAEVHLAIGSDGKATLAAGAFDEGLVGRAGFFGRRCSPVREHLLIDPDLFFRGKAILQWRPIAGDGGHDFKAILKLQMQRFHQLPTGLDLAAINGGHRHPDDDRQPGCGKVGQPLSKLPIGSRDPGHPFIDFVGRAIDRDVDLTDADLKEQVCERPGDAGGVAHEVNHQSLPARMSQDVADVWSHAWFASCEGHGEHSQIGELVQERADLAGRKFMGQGAMGGVVTMDAAQVAAVGQLKGHAFRSASGSRFGREEF